LKRKVWVFLLLVGLFSILSTIAFSVWNEDISIGLMGSAEQACISDMQFVDNTPIGDIIRLTVRNVGATTVNINCVYVNENVAINFTSCTIAILKGCSLEVPLIFTNDTLVFGSHYSVKAITYKGNCLVYSGIYDSAHSSKYDPLKDNLNPTTFDYITNQAEPFWAPLVTTPFIVFFVATLVFVPFACKLACYILGPKNRVDIIILLFFVTLMVVAAIIYVVTMVLFPPQICL
jgi:hypothetical protein